MTRTRQPTHGYTLLELVLVLAILGAALAVVAPSLSGFGAGRKTEEAAARFVALTRFARSQAISDGSPYRIAIEPATSAFRVQVQEIDTFVDLEGRSFTPAEGISIETTAPLDQGLNVIVFDTLGRSQPADVVFKGARGQVSVTCELPTEEYHIVAQAEVR